MPSFFNWGKDSNLAKPPTHLNILEMFKANHEGSDLVYTDQGDIYLPDGSINPNSDGQIPKFTVCKSLTQ